MPMTLRLQPVVAAISLLFVAALPPTASPQSAQPGASQVAIPDIPFTKFTLANSLTVIVNEDHSAPVVHVGVWYRVGSRDDLSGRTGSLGSLRPTSQRTFTSESIIMLGTHLWKLAALAFI